MIGKADWSYSDNDKRGDMMVKKVKIKKQMEPYLYLLPTVFLMIVLLVVPICLIVKYSFQNNAIIVAEPVFVGLENYKKILMDSEFLTAVKTTLIFVAVSVAAHIILGMCFALLLNTKYFTRTTKTIARVIYVLPWVFTASVIAILWKLILQPQGIADYLLSFVNLATKHTEWLSNRDIALPVITFVNIWCGYPFYMISILAGLQGISQDLYESAALDGAGKWRTFIYITIPQLKPVLISIAMLDFVWSLQSFAIIWMMTGGGPVNSTQTLSVYIYKLAFNGSQYGLASAVAVILLAICILVAVFYVKQQKKVRE